MSARNPMDAIKALQRAWAFRRGLSLDRDGYCGCADDNLFLGLSADARNDFAQGDGTELGRPGARGKIQALHSSSALACNWFDYWRTRDLNPLTKAFGVASPFIDLRLEAKLSTGLGGKGPNLDVLLTSADTGLFGVESKFAEPYTPSAAKTSLKPKYFDGGPRLWSDAGLAGCQAVADALRTGRHGFNVLDVAQLLKHMLALARAGGKRWSLCCLWFEVPGAIAVQHRAELNQFAIQIGADAARFSTQTYQELFLRMLPSIPQEHGQYIAYLQERYLSAVDI